MNTKLAESLAEAVVALPTEEYALFQQAIIDLMIRKTPGVAGGYACVRNTRIAVWTLVSLLRQEMHEDELLNDFPGLTPFDLFAVQAYYRTNKSEIDELIASHYREEDWDNSKQPLLETTRQPLNLTDFAFVGMWQDRPEMQDSSAWVRQQRQ